MDEKKEKNAFTTYDVQNNEDAREVFEQFIAVAHVDSVFGQPLTVGEYTVITASEVSVAMGIGYGKGYGNYPAKGERDIKEQSSAGSGGGGRRFSGTTGGNHKHWSERNNSGSSTRFYKGIDSTDHCLRKHGISIFADAGKIKKITIIWTPDILFF